MVWLLLVLGTLAVVECFIRLPFMARIKYLKTLLAKISRVLRSSSISDHWKEKILPTYAWQLFSSSILLFCYVVLAILPLVILAYVATQFGVPLLVMISSITGIVASTVIAVAYIFIRNFAVRA